MSSDAGNMFLFEILLNTKRGSVKQFDINLWHLFFFSPTKQTKLGDTELMDGFRLRGASSSSWLILMTNPVVNDRPVTLFSLQCVSRGLFLYSNIHAAACERYQSWCFLTVWNRKDKNKHFITHDIYPAACICLLVCISLHWHYLYWFDEAVLIVMWCEDKMGNWCCSINIKYVQPG